MTLPDHVLQAQADFRRQMGELEALTSRMRQTSKAVSAQLQGELQSLRRARQEAMGEYEESARSGDEGPARRELQARLDRGETTWRDVISGDDTHWSAEEVRDELVGDARAEIDQLELEDPEFARAYREHAVLRGDDRPGEWTP